MIDIKSAFEAAEDDFLKFEAYKNPLHRRPDIAAFLLLDMLDPDNEDIVTAAEHDEIFLAVCMKNLAKVATEEDIRNLRRCGVCYSSEYDLLSMFV